MSLGNNPSVSPAGLLVLGLAVGVGLLVSGWTGYLWRAGLWKEDVGVKGTEAWAGALPRLSFLWHPGFWGVLGYFSI